MRPETLILLADRVTHGAVLLTVPLHRRVGDAPLADAANSTAVAYHTTTSVTVCNPVNRRTSLRLSLTSPGRRSWPAPSCGPAGRA